MSDKIVINDEALKTIADLVMEVTHEGSKDKYGYYFPRLKTTRGIILKFADRLSNLTRMGAWDDDRIDQYIRRSKFWRDPPPLAAIRGGRPIGDGAPRTEVFRVGDNDLSPAVLAH